MTHTRTEVADAIDAGAVQIETYGLTPNRFLDWTNTTAPHRQRACCPIGGIRIRAGLNPFDTSPLTHEAVSELAAHVVAEEGACEQSTPDGTLFAWVSGFRPSDAAEVASVMRGCAAELRRSP